MDQEVDVSSLEFRTLSENQKRLLAILPIPSAILSLIGSSVIVYMAMRSRRDARKKWTPYNRLIMGMSSFDILTSITLIFASFLYPKETSDKAWVIGTEATCSIVGALNQLIYGVICYYCSLSVYLLLTARFGFTNSQISHRIEPFMHVFCFGYPLVTSFVGLFLGAYDEPEIGMGCWVKRWPKRCIAYREPVGSEEACRSREVGWILGGWVGAGTFVVALFSTVVLFVHVRLKENKLMIKKPTKKQQPCEGVNRSSAFRTEMMSCEASVRYEESMKNHDDDDDESEISDAGSDTLVSSIRTIPSDPTALDERAAQLKQLNRLKLVRTQALLYFLSYYCTSGWGQLLRLLESTAQTPVEEKELPYKYYYMLLCQCILYPLQGLTNLIVFVRPKYLKHRSECPDEPRWWVLKQVILDDDHPLERSPNSCRQLADDEMRQYIMSEDDTQLGLSIEGNESTPTHTRKVSLDHTTATLSPAPACDPVEKVLPKVASGVSLASMTKGDEKEVMERTKRRLEKYKADRLNKSPSSSSVNNEANGSKGGSSVAMEMMSPIQKVRAKLKMEAPGIPDIFSDESDNDEPPMPVPETMERSPSRGKDETENVKPKLEMPGIPDIFGDDSDNDDDPPMQVPAETMERSPSRGKGETENSRAKPKLEMPGIPDMFSDDDDDDDDDPPLPVKRTASSHRGNGIFGPSAVRMDGSIVQGDSSEFEFET